MKLVAQYDETAIKALIIADLEAKGLIARPNNIRVDTEVSGQYEEQEFHFKGFVAEVEQPASPSPKKS